MPDLWEGARRLPYFFTLERLDRGSYETKQWVLCPQCALEHVQDGELVAHYTTLRSVMCARCGIVMGPINKAEMEAGEDE